MMRTRDQPDWHFARRRHGCWRWFQGFEPLDVLFEVFTAGADGRRNGTAASTKWLPPIPDRSRGGGNGVDHFGADPMAAANLRRMAWVPSALRIHGLSEIVQKGGVWAPMSAPNSAARMLAILEVSTACASWF